MRFHLGRVSMAFLGVRAALLLGLLMLGTACTSVPEDPHAKLKVMDSASADIDLATLSTTCRPPSPTPPSATERALYAARLAAYQQLTEEALSSRAMAIRLFHELNAKTGAGGVLSGDDLLRLNSGAAALLAQREELLEIALAHECWVELPPLADPAAAATQRSGVLMSLAAALTLYDNYLSAISLYRGDATLRRHLNRPDRGFALGSGTLDRITRSFASPALRQRVRRAIEWYEAYGTTADGPPEDGDVYLTALIEQSPSLHLVRRRHPLRELGTGVGLFRVAAADTLLGLKDEGVHLSSLLFGNTIGLVETRRGKLDRRPDVAARVAGTLRAGDILLEKTPFRLTDTFIPGHWGHAAVWIGSEAELVELGIWEHPELRPYQADIRAGRGVVEALRSGVELNALESFLNIDDLALLRHADMTPEARAETILQALRQVGKAYDFNFDAETTKRVFCSKLVYLAYGDLGWPTSRIFGRSTISPDDIAARATGDGPLQVALLFHDGAEIADTPRSALLRLTARTPDTLAGGTAAAPLRSAVP